MGFINWYFLAHVMKLYLIEFILINMEEKKT